MTGPEFAAKRRSFGWNQSELAHVVRQSRRTVTRVENMAEVPVLWAKAMESLENNPVNARDPVTE